MSGGPTYGKNPPSNALAFGVKSSQHWQSWSEMQEQWRFAEETGWDSVWAFDHFFSLSDSEMGETLDGWTLLAGFAQMTTRVQLGLMVTGMTHRLPAVLFKQAVTVDHISGGRLVLAVGASWNEREHEAYGIEFPSARERVDRFAEAMEMNRLLETQERTTFEGQHYRLVDAPFEPKPVFGHIPILIGSTGKRMLRYVAAYADQWDGRADTPDEYRANGEQLIGRCQEIGRDPADIRWVRHAGKDQLALVASEDVFRKHVEDYVRVGVRSFIFSIPTGSPSRALRNIAEQVIPELREQFAAGTLTA
ncbi:MAG TPA: LLM class flavin-dependent oxidoreductase [Thermomicrobiales bacterium]|nr:LLM class flavin-dependent oxidoreductase [Thermomicrobiales bacterium]